MRVVTPGLAAPALSALGDLRVIDLTRVLGGPYAAQVLGDHGADIIKVEPPSGDETRDWGPPFFEGTASYFQGVNRNKRAMTLDLKRPAGREVLMRLLSRADVLVENFKPGTLEGWGLGFDDTLAERFPRLIQCHISGFGADGPLGGLPGYDAILQALSGIMSVNGTGDGGPTRVGLPVVDMTAGLNAALGILLALHHREKTGRGQFVEVTLFDTALSLLHPHGANYFVSGSVPNRTGNDHPNISPYSVYTTGSRPIYLAVGNDRQFQTLCRAIGAPALANDPRFRTNGERVHNREALRVELERALAGADGAELADELIRAGVPAAPVLDVGEGLEHAHTRHRRMVVDIDGYRGLGAPVRLSQSAAGYRRKPPAFGEHTRDVLTQLGFSQQECDELEASGITPSDRRRL